MTLWRRNVCMPSWRSRASAGIDKKTWTSLVCTSPIAFPIILPSTWRSVAFGGVCRFDDNSTLALLIFLHTFDGEDASDFRPG